MSMTQDPGRLPEESPGEQRQIIAMFETFERARSARDRLAEEGVRVADMDIVNRDVAEGDADSRPKDSGVWASIRGFFVPEEERHAYAEGVERGHVLLAVRPPPGAHERVVNTLESFDPIDFDASMNEWRASGWSGRSTLADPDLADADLANPDLADPDMPARTARPATMESGPERSDETIPVMEERLRVGKRAVERGGVRVRSYIVERPISEDVPLHEETVEVERHPVDPTRTATDDAFRERTIEATAYGEEPVVQKEARVVEEVGLRKRSTEHTEKVSDSARKTEVEVEDKSGKRRT